VRYLTLAEALVIGEAVTGTEAAVLAKASRLELLDSALHAPQAGFGEEDFYPSLQEKAAVLAVRVASNHPLPDGNKRLAWQSLRMFLALNGHRMVVTDDEAVDLMLGIAAGESDEAAVTAWLEDRIEPEEG
jgi:death on curing protein